jgi:hypothetical protein
MSSYSLGLPSTVTTANAACWGFLAPSDQSPRITELIITQGAATASVYGFGRAASAGTQSSSTPVLPDNAGDATSGKSTCASTWSVAPTVPANYLRRINLGGVVGDAAVLIFPRGIGVAASSEMVLWNITTNSAAISVNVSSEE